ncbi:kinase-like protein [Auricularia subglabra TFB-10046 SS5]|nr:kinase-like protein [Auricularia subglabra TFB-10046 SS5]
MQHERIVPFLGTAEVANAVIIVTPFMKNGNLLAFLLEHPSSTRTLRPQLVQVADAVNYLHTEAELVHGDLKCENVLVSDDGRALLADFGLSTLVEKADADETTRSGFRAWGTLPFAAPELLLDQATSNSGRRRSKTPASDVYAFGMLMLQVGSSLTPRRARYHETQGIHGKATVGGVHSATDCIECRSHRDARFPPPPRDEHPARSH